MYFVVVFSYWGLFSKNNVFLLFSTSSLIALDFFHENSRFTRQQGKGEAISMARLYQFHPLLKHLDLSQAVILESSLRHITSSHLCNIYLYSVFTILNFQK